MKKLRNKKTGEIAKNVSSFDTRDFKIGIEYEDSLGYSNRVAYDSLAELNEVWEDYESAEPLIKDEKVRKAVRAWAEANEIETVEYDDYWVSLRRDDKVISFKDEDTCLGLYNLEDNKTYTIDELCGEEE